MKHPPVRIFGDSLVPGTEYVVLERVLAAARILSEQDVAMLWQKSQAIPHVAAQDGRRIWWRYRRKDATFAYISVQPGEYRESPPQEPCDIRDLPETPSQISCLEILEAARSLCSMFKPWTDREVALLKSADQMLGVGSEIGVSRRDALARFEKASEIGRTRPAQEFGKILNELYENCLFSFELPVVEFSDLVLLLQLQRSLSAWIEQPWYQNPTGFRNAYLDIVQKDRSKRIEFIRTAIDAGNFEYRTAVSEVRRAFESGPMLSMSQLLMLAHHRFRAAWWFHRESVKMGGAPGEFEFSEISAEEGAVCTLTGISIGAMYCARPQAEHARNILYEGAPDLSSLRRSARRLATHIQPIFTRDFCDILAAQAMTLSPSTEAVKIGINELNTLHAKLSREVSDCEYERSWIDQALLSAYKKVSDDGATSRTATRIAGRLIIRRVL